MASGLLTGAFTAERAAGRDSGDWRAGDLDFREPALQANLARADALGLVAERHGLTTAAVAVAWTLCFPRLTGANRGCPVAPPGSGLAAGGAPEAEGGRPSRHRRRHPRLWRRRRTRFAALPRS
jgi:hypothetical protein